MDDATADLVLTLQLEDLRALNRDFPQVSDDESPTDAHVALNLYREELRDNALALSDHRLGEKLGRADGIMSGPPSPIEAPTPIFNEVHARFDINRECTACEEVKDPAQLIIAPCGHQYCAYCVGELFDLAIKDESLFPPRCCKQPITLALANRFLNDNQIQVFEEKAVEHATVDKTYCHYNRCARFIPPSEITGEKATCKRCSLQTCTVCKSAAHESDCPEDPNYVALMETAEAAGYRACYRCKRMVELDFGCNHITCLCTAEFCYACGVKWKECVCRLWDETRLFVRRDAIVDRLPVLPEIPRVQQAEQIEEDLRERHECVHRYFKRINGEAQCEICHSRLHDYLLECRQCHLRACVKCKRNRL